MKKILLASVFVGTTLLVSGCSTPAKEAFQEGKPSEVSQDSYIGLSVEGAQKEAETQGVPFRVVQQDGEFFAVTMDFRPGRINAVVENGIVTSFEVEGGESFGE